MREKTLVFVGGGHAHLFSLQRAEELARLGCAPVLISPHRFQYYSGMGPGMLGGTYSPEAVRFDLQHLCEENGVEFVEDAVVGVDPSGKTLRLAGGDEVRYDLASFNTGSRVADERIPGSETFAVPVKPIVNLIRVREMMTQADASRPRRVAVIGGGPAGVEIAGNLWRATQLGEAGTEIHLLEGADRLLPSMPEKCAKLAHRSLEERGILVRTGFKTAEITGEEVVGKEGEAIPADLALLATGTVPGTLFSQAALTEGDDPGLAVDETLRHRIQRELFAVGDCAHHPHQPIDRVGVYAVRQAPILFENLKAALIGGRMHPFTPQKTYLLILNMGDRTGILQWGPLVVRARWAWTFKRYLDMSFMKRFQPARGGLHGP